MHFRITGDIDSASGIGEIICEISGPTRKHFQANSCGDGLLGIVVVLMCQDDALNLKRRIRLAKKDKTLYLDIMLDLDRMKSVAPDLKLQRVIQSITTEVPNTLAKYAIKDFDAMKFNADLIAWMHTFRT